MQLATDPETGQRGLFLFSKDGHIVSPWHDAPLIADKSQNLFHMIVEIPRGAKAKMEVGSPYYATGGMLKIRRSVKRNGIIQSNRIFHPMVNLESFLTFPPFADIRATMVHFPR